MSASTEVRNAYGFPVDPVDPDVGEAWPEELPEAERAGLRLLQERVEWALGGYLSEGLARLACEETLWQIRMELRRAGRVVLPDVGTLEWLDTDRGPALVSVASPGLQDAP